MSADSKNARATFELANDVAEVSAMDAVFRHNQQEQQQLLQAKPWARE